MNSSTRRGADRVRRRAGAAVALLSCWLAVAAVAQSPVSRDGEPAEPEFAGSLRCGDTVRGQLSAGHSDRYGFQAAAGQRIAVDVVDLSANGELLRLRIFGEGVAANTCVGRVQPPSRTATNLTAGERYTVDVADCDYRDDVEYTLTMNIVSGIAQNCGTRLACRAATEAEFSVPAEVDSYRFEGTVGDSVLLETSAVDPNLTGIELRVFDPDGEPIDSGRPGTSGCASSRTVALPKTGIYTVLANACFGGDVGQYRIRWWPRSCPPISQLGRHTDGDAIGVRTTYDGSAVVEIATGPMSCGFAETAGFVWQPSPPLPVENGRFRGRGLRLPARDLTLDIDGVLADADADGRLDQSLGGLSFAKRGGRCNLEWNATALTDSDGDSWSDVAERQFGSSPNLDSSTPEGRDVRSTTLIGPDRCHDYLDNDGDGDVDGSDDACAASPSREEPAPTVFAGRHTTGSLIVQLADDGIEVVQVATNGFQCGSLDTGVQSFDLHIPIRQGRFSGQAMPLIGDGTSTWIIDGEVFDGDGDSVPDQAIGGIELRTGAFVCRLLWQATAQRDDDSDGWGDSVERRMGSDPVPLPVGEGASSTPEHRSVPTTLLSGASACEDGIDNDADDAIDGQDSPACESPTVTATPSQVITPTQTPPPTSTATAPPSPVATATPAATITPTGPNAATATPTRDAPCLGDCDGDGTVTIDEILRGVGILLTGEFVLTCPELDGNGDGSVTVDEIIAAIAHALDGCPPG